MFCNWRLVFTVSKKSVLFPIGLFFNLNSYLNKSNVGAPSLRNTGFYKLICICSWTICLEVEEKWAFWGLPAFLPTLLRDRSLLPSVQKLHPSKMQKLYFIQIGYLVSLGPIVWFSTSWVILFKLGMLICSHEGLNFASPLKNQISALYGCNIWIIFKIIHEFRTVV